MKFVSFDTTRAPVMVNAEHVTHLEVLSTGDSPRTRIHFIGGRDVEVIASADSVAGKLAGKAAGRSA